MEPGELRDRVEIQRRSQAQDNFGAPAGSWQTLATVCAKIEPMNGKEAFSAGAIQAGVDTRITTRYRDDIRPEYRIVFGAQIFDVKAVIPDVLRTRLEIICKGAA